MSALSPAPRLFTRDEYHRAGDLGLFGPEERLELIEGEVIQKVSPQSDPHAWAITVGADVLEAAFGAGFHVRQEKPLVLSDYTEPEPDIAVIVGSARDTLQHPTSLNAVLVLEVAESTLAFDQGRKAASYARSGIRDYWVLNLRSRNLEVRRDPAEITEAEYAYRTVQLFTAQMSVAPLAAPAATIRVDDLLPPSGMGGQKR